MLNFVRDEDTRVPRARWTSHDREAHVTDQRSAQTCERKDMAMAAAVRGARNVGMDGARRLLSTQTLPDLPYDYSALEPYISAEIMQLHHAKHHQTYVNNFNALAEQYTDAESKGDVAKMIAMQSGIKFNGGGHVNHSIFWKNLCPANQFEPPTGKLAAAIDESFGGLDSLQKKFNPAAAAVQGSGWAWLALHPESKKLQVVTTSNQDPCSTTGHVPLLGVDVWEHAYYLQYKNVRPDYLKAIWNVVNWKDVAERFEKATA